MQPLERYGVIGLLFLAVATIAVFVWNDDPAPLGDQGGGFLATAPPGRPSAQPVSTPGVARGVERQERIPVPEETAQMRAERERQERVARMQEFAARGRSSSPQATPVATEEESVDPGVDWRAERNRRGADEVRNDTAAASGRQNRLAGRSANGTALELNRAASEVQTDVRTPNDGDSGTSGARADSGGASDAAKRKSSRTPKPEAGGDYVVQNGDTLTGIAQKLLGRASRWEEIRDLNPGLNPAALRVGRSILVPAGAAVANSVQATRDEPADRENKSASANSESYVVRSGDSLWRIADRALGDGGRWREIVSANPGLNPNKLVVGSKLRLPTGAAADVRGSDRTGPARTSVAKSDSRKSGRRAVR